MIRQKIALFASGRGTNAINIIQHFKNHPKIEIALLICNKTDSPVVKQVKKYKVNSVICSNENIEKPHYLIEICEKYNINWVILAGFLRKIPPDFVQHFEHKIINIHPALLPKYGGEGMFGKFVHQAVLSNKEKETGITIHFVNSEYDKGKIIAQFSCALDENDTIESIQEKIHNLEMENYPKTIEDLIA